MNVITPKMYYFLMVPITSNEILFLGGVRGGESGEVSVLNLLDLKLRILSNNANYCFSSTTNSFHVSQYGEISAVV